MAVTIPAAQLAALDTPALVAQYDLAVSSYAGRLTNCSPRQKRVDRIVDLIDARADAGDQLALDWLRAA